MCVFSLCVCPVLYIVYCSLVKDVAVSINTTNKIECCDWFVIQPCTEVDDNVMFGKPSCTHGISVSLWLLRYIQCGFGISHQSFPGIVAHHRCNISHIFTFSFQFQCAMSCCALHLSNIFSEGVKTGWHGMKVGG